jgi:hypothetical protein
METATRIKKSGRARRALTVEAHEGYREVAHRRWSTSQHDSRHAQRAYALTKTN